MPKLLHREELPDSDAYELAYARSYPDGHWSPGSLYLYDDEEGIGALIAPLSAVYPRFNWYGPNQISLADWARVEALADPACEPFFAEVQRWLKGNGRADYFWLLGP